MARNRRSFTAEFKHEGASLVTEHGYSIIEACRAIDEGETALQRRGEQLENELSLSC